MRALTGGMTNAVFRCSKPGGDNQTVLVRSYGKGTEVSPANRTTVLYRPADEQAPLQNAGMWGCSLARKSGSSLASISTGNLAQIDGDETISGLVAKNVKRPTCLTSSLRAGRTPVPLEGTRIAGRGQSCLLQGLEDRGSGVAVSRRALLLGEGACSIAIHPFRSRPATRRFHLSSPLSLIRVCCRVLRSIPGPSRCSSVERGS